MDIKRSGSQSSAKGPAEYFIGTVRIDPLFEAHDPARTSGASVMFEAGARTAWHTHPLGQTLIVTTGCGLVQRWGQRFQRSNCLRVREARRGRTDQGSGARLRFAEHPHQRRVSWNHRHPDDGSLQRRHSQRPPTGDLAGANWQDGPARRDR